MHFNTVCTCVAVVKGAVGAPYNRSGVLHGCAARWCLWVLEWLKTWCSLKFKSNVIAVNTLILGYVLLAGTTQK